MILYSNKNCFISENGEFMINYGLNRNYIIINLKLLDVM